MQKALPFIVAQPRILLLCTVADLFAAAAHHSRIGHSRSGRVRHGDWQAPSSSERGPQVQHKQQEHQQLDGLVSFEETAAEPQDPLLHRMQHHHRHQQQLPNGDQAADEDADASAAVPGEKLLIPKVRTFSCWTRPPPRSWSSISKRRRRCTPA